MKTASRLILVAVLVAQFALLWQGAALRYDVACLYEMVDESINGPHGEYAGE